MSCSGRRWSSCASSTRARSSLPLQASFLHWLPKVTRILLPARATRLSTSGAGGRQLASGRTAEPYRKTGRLNASSITTSQSASDACCVGRSLGCAAPGGSVFGEGGLRRRDEDGRSFAGASAGSAAKTAMKSRSTRATRPYITAHGLSTCAKTMLYAAGRISSTRKGTKSAFGTLQAPATTTFHFDPLPNQSHRARVRLLALASSCHVFRVLLPDCYQTPLSSL